MGKTGGRGQIPSLPQERQRLDKDCRYDRRLLYLDRGQIRDFLYIYSPLREQCRYRLYKRLSVGGQNHTFYTGAFDQQPDLNVQGGEDQLEKGHRGREIQDLL